MLARDPDSNVTKELVSSVQGPMTKSANTFHLLDFTSLGLPVVVVVCARSNGILGCGSYLCCKHETHQTNQM